MYVETTMQQRASQPCAALRLLDRAGVALGFGVVGDTAQLAGAVEVRDGLAVDSEHLVLPRSTRSL